MMRRITISISLALTLALPVFAADLDTRAPVKPPSNHVATPPDPAVVRQGGDTIADAVFVSLPYHGTGTTVGYTDDYDEVCPYSGSYSPDVVYTVTPQQDDSWTIDLLGSSYDTKLYIYDEDLNLVACNDDFYPNYVSRLDDVELLAGVQYFIVVDGWYGDAGTYVIDIGSSDPCELDCPAGAELEGEPPLVDGYQDAFNGGCEYPEFGYNFSTITQPLFCGISGWYTVGGAQYRDNDYFELVAPASGVIELVADAEYSTLLMRYIHDCDDMHVFQIAEAGPCQSGEMTIVSNPGVTIRMFVRPAIPEGPVNEYRYVIESNLGVVATEARSWSAVRNLYDGD